MKFRIGVFSLLLAIAGGEATAQCTTGQVTTAGVTETGTVNFNGLNAGQSVAVGGLTLSCTTGSPNAPEVATFFESLPNGSAGPAAPAGCTKSGTLSGWTSVARSGQTVSFTSVTPNANVTDLPVSGTSGTVTRVQGSFSLASLFTGSLVCGRPAVGYTGPASDRWQEQHRAGGQLWDFKLGVGHPVDPQKQVGTYSFGVFGTTSTITHAYTASSFSWRVYLQAAPNTYSFCTAAGVEVVRAFVIAGAGVSGSGCSGSFPP